MAFAAVLFIAACGNGDDAPDVDYPVEYFNATVVSSVLDGDLVTMTIEGEGFYPMTVEVSFDGGTMTVFNVSDHSESADWGGAIIERGDVQSAIIDYADNMGDFDVDDYKEVDGDAAATATVEALEDIANAAIEHYQAYYAD